MSFALPRLAHRLTLAVTAFACLSGSAASPSWGQRPVHPLYRSSMPPGAVAASKAAHMPSRQGYIQPVEVRVPAGATVAVASDGGFGWESAPLRAGLLVGQVYRFRVSGIPRYPEAQLYPSVEVIDRLHPPAEHKDRFPIPVEITQDDLELALQGNMIVRVVYLENPHQAFPEREGDEQRTVDVLPAEDPLHVADQIGRPMAILRIGSRIPLEGELNGSFLFGSPPVQPLAEPPGALEYYGESTVDEISSPHPPAMITPEAPVADPASQFDPGVEKRLTRPELPALPGPASDDPFLDDSIR